MSSHIGIVALSPEGSSFCYRLIGRRASQVDDPALRPIVTLHNRPFSTYVEALDNEDWEQIAVLLQDSARVLAAAGADFCVLPDNVAHHALPIAEVDSPIPWLNMISLVADSISQAGCATVGLIGTKHVTYGSTYQTVLGLKGIHLKVPNERHVETINKIIFTEAIYGRVRPQSQALVNDAISSLGAAGCEGVILGCSEASLLTAVGDTPLPVFDPVELLAEAAIDRAIGEASSQ